MTRYIALLRGINVGGKNKIAMPELKKAFESQGYKNVITYINSGNVIFDSTLEQLAVQSACGTLIEIAFGFKIAVAIISASELHDAIAHAPNWWNSNPESKHNALFVISHATAKSVCDEIGEVKPEYEKLSYYGKVIFWSAPIATFSRTSLTKIMNSKTINNLITVRNANTTLKLKTLVGLPY